MLEKRILDSSNKIDIDQFENIISEYAEFQKDKPNPLYFYDDMFNYTVWLRKQFKHRNPKDFIVAGLFDGNNLIQIMVGYKIEISWHKPKIEDNFPFYVVGTVFFKNSYWKVPQEDISNLDELITDHFEKQGYTDGFMVIKAPSFIRKTTDGEQIDEFMKTVFTKTFKDTKHNYFVEHIFRTNDDLDEYKFKAIKSILPSKIKRPLILVSFKLKTQYRGQ